MVLIDEKGLNAVRSLPSHERPLRIDTAGKAIAVR
jgi:hypothetical protein